MVSERCAWHSPNTGRTMRLARFGDRGLPLLYVPSSGGDETEFERYGMHEDCARWIAAGRLQVVSVDGCGPRTFWNDRITPPERIQGHAAFERYLADEVLPWTAHATGRPRPVAVGASYGGLAVANLLFKRPASVRRVCGLGGVYGLWHRLDGHHDYEVYSHTPLDYLERLETGSILAAIRRTEGIALYAAELDEWCESTRRLVALLRAKQLPHSLEVWPAPADHHERWWKRQLVRFLERLAPR